MFGAQLIPLATRDRIAGIGADARAVRRRVVSRAIEQAALPDIGVHLYPRSFSYDVDVSLEATGTHVLMYGSDSRGRTVAARVTGFRPYFFVRALDASTQAVAAFVGQLNDALITLTMQRMNGAIGSGVRRLVGLRRVAPIVSYTLVSGVSVNGAEGFNDGADERFVQIFVYSPAYVRAARDVLEHMWRERAAPATTLVHVTALLAGARSSWDAPPPAPTLVIARRTLDPLAIATASDDDDDDDMPDSPDTHWTDPSVPDDEEPAERPRDAFDVSNAHVASAINRMHARCNNHVSLQRSLRLSDTRAVDVYEADIDFVVRYCIDAGFKPEECVVLAPTSRAHVLTRAGANTLNDVQFTCDWRDLARCADDRFQNVLPPQAVFSFDAEMELGPRNAFPKPESERILQWCTAAFDPIVDPTAVHAVRRLFVLGTIALPSEEEQRATQAFVIAPDEVYTFSSETTMLMAIAEYMRSIQPDVFTGYNIENFDLNYYKARADVLGCGSLAAAICRSEHGAMRIVDCSFSSAAHGTHLSKEVRGEGMYVFDVFPALKRSNAYKLRSYSLDAVSEALIQERKDDVAYSRINTLQTTPEGRFELMRYCAKDATLPCRLLGFLALLTENIEQARLTGVPIDMVCRRGIQVRLKGFLYRHCAAKEPRHFFYTRTAAERAAVGGADDDDDSYAGAFVIDPERGLHTTPIATLDFESLYPSIMISHNLCFTTIVHAADAAANAHHLDFDADTTRVADDAMAGGIDAQPRFVKSTRRKGLLPEVLEILLAERARVRAMAKAHKKGSSMHQLLDKRQLARKLLANSLYGMTGATSGFGYCRAIAAAVTAAGRFIIMATKAIVEAEFTPARGYAYTARVVYGDTDSVFVRIEPVGTMTLEESAAAAICMAAFVTAYFQRLYGARADNRLKIVFEKIFSKIIFYAKKRYVGWKWELDTDAATLTLVRKKKPSASGMETERRDSCLLVSEAVSTVVGMLLADGTSRAESLARVRTYLVNDVIGALRAGRVPWNLLIQSKQFRKRADEYTAAGRSAPMHIALAARLEALLGVNAPGTYQPGDRIQFVVREATYPGEPSSALSEDPNDAWTRSLTLSHDHYTKNAVIGTMARILDPILETPVASATLEEQLDANVEHKTPVMAKASKAQAKKAAEKRLHAFLDAEPAKRARITVAPRQSGLLALAVAVPRCRLCGVPGAVVCGAHSAAELAALEATTTTATRTLAEEREALGRECAACKQGWRAEKQPARAALLPPMPPAADIEEAYPCPSTTCPVFWRRRLVDRKRKRGE